MLTTDSGVYPSPLKDYNRFTPIYTYFESWCILLYSYSIALVTATLIPIDKLNTKEQLESELFRFTNEKVLLIRLTPDNSSSSVAKWKLEKASYRDKWKIQEDDVDIILTFIDNNGKELFVGLLEGHITPINVTFVWNHIQMMQSLGMNNMSDPGYKDFLIDFVNSYHIAESSIQWKSPLIGVLEGHRYVRIIKEYPNGKNASDTYHKI